MHVHRNLLFNGKYNSHSALLDYVRKFMTDEGGGKRMLEFRRIRISIFFPLISAVCLLSIPIKFVFTWNERCFYAEERKTF